MVDWLAACLLGDMYAVVPGTSPGTVSADAVFRSVPANAEAFAIPKSSTFTWPERVSMMFCGLMSRWTIPSRVRLGESLGDLTSDSYRQTADREGPLLQPLGQRLSVDVLHRDVAMAVGLPDFVDRADIRVVEPRGGLCLAHQTFACGVVCGERIRAAASARPAGSDRVSSAR